jgi:DNA modification methylase
MGKRNDVPGTGQGALFELEPEEGGLPPNLMERFVVPPFSVLDARQGYWQGRKRAWISLGIKSELGRGEQLKAGEGEFKAKEGNLTWGKGLDYSHKHKEDRDRKEQDRLEKLGYEANGGGLTYGDSPQIAEKGLNYYRNSARREREQAEYEANTNRSTSGAITAQHIGEAYGRKEMTGTSIFDPVLCEVAYRWFSPAGGRVLDPFAGGSVRGIVAAKLGRSYTGIDLSPYQVDANKLQAEEICGKDPYKPRWINGDSQHIPKLLDGEPEVDFVFSCPPYYDLEVYSKDKRDISNAGSYGDFYKAYRRIIWLACERLKQDRFAAIVIGDIRDGKTGMYRSFLQDTIEAFELAGLELYNNAVLVTVTGSLPVRVGKQFTAGRKLGRTHQYFLTFVKGDPKKATQAVGDCQAGIPEDW